MTPAMRAIVVLAALLSPIGAVAQHVPLPRPKPAQAGTAFVEHSGTQNKEQTITGRQFTPPEREIRKASTSAVAKE